MQRMLRAVRIEETGAEPVRAAAAPAALSPAGEDYGAKPRGLLVGVAFGAILPEGGVC